MSAQALATNALLFVTVLTFTVNWFNIFIYCCNKILAEEECSYPSEQIFPRTLLFLLIAEVLIFYYLVGTMAK